MKAIIKLVVFLLMVHALFRFVPPYWEHTQFVRELKDSSIGWREYTDPEVRELVLAMAQARSLPLGREQIRIRRERDHLFVDLAYSRRLELVPGSKYTWDFESQVDTWMLTPQGRSR
jgi:hypothetical protein